MQSKGVDQLVQKWLNEPAFKAKMSKDPEGTAKAAGISLSSEEWATVRNVMTASANTALRTRVSKGGGRGYAN